MDGEEYLRVAMTYTDSVHDYVNRDMQITILTEEKHHIARLETELDLFSKISLQTYLQSQIKVEG